MTEEDSIPQETTSASNEASVNIDGEADTDAAAVNADMDNTESSPTNEEPSDPTQNEISDPSLAGEMTDQNASESNQTMEEAPQNEETAAEVVDVVTTPVVAQEAAYVGGEEANNGENVSGDVDDSSKDYIGPGAMHNPLVEHTLGAGAEEEEQAPSESLLSLMEASNNAANEAMEASNNAANEAMEASNNAANEAMEASNNVANEAMEGEGEANATSAEPQASQESPPGDEAPLALEPKVETSSTAFVSSPVPTPDAAPMQTTTPKEKRKRGASKTPASCKRKRKSNGVNGEKGRKSKNSSEIDSDSDSYESDEEEYNREFSRPSRRSLKNSPDFAKAYAEYSKAAQEKKSAESHFDKVLRQYEAALERKMLAEQNLLNTKEALYEADLQVSCYWNTMYHKLVKYREVHGHCMVPYTRGVVTDAEEKKLGAWVHCQRKNYHNYQKGLKQHEEGKQHQADPQAAPPTPTSSGGQGNNRMKPQRIVALEKLGFVWSFFDTKWSQRIKDLVGYKVQHGHLNVPFKYPPNQSLAHWVHNQRRDYNLFQEGKPSQMTVEKINELEALGFAWKSDYPRTKRKLTPEPVSLTEAELWGENYNALVNFHSQHGHCSVNRFTSPNRKLCAWLTWQRKQHKLYMMRQPSQLNPERIKKLNDLGFEWTPRNKPGSGGVLNSPSPSNVIMPLTTSIPEADTMTIPMDIGAKSESVKMEVAVAPTPQYTESDMKMEEYHHQQQEDNKMEVTAVQAPDPLNQHQHLQLLHAVEDDEVALMAQI